VCGAKKKKYGEPDRRNGGVNLKKHAHRFDEVDALSSAGFGWRVRICHRNNVRVNRVMQPRSACSAESALAAVEVAPAFSASPSPSPAARELIEQ
jgi:hypothetical protein